MGTNKYQSAFKKGRLNLISDVPGIKVGHKTLDNNEIKTGVTVIIPSNDNIFQNKLPCASYVANGFGKTSGLVQIEELGTLESLIGLTNTLNVGTVQQALVEHMLIDNTDIGVSTGTINVVTCECNDGRLNDIRGCHVTKDDVNQAIENAVVEFEEGNIGAGTGMVCFGMKGGIGSSSREIILDNKTYHIGSLVLSNFGLKNDFIFKELPSDNEKILEKGSIIMILATDIPMDYRQLRRLCKRTPIALGRLGSYMGNGSGDIAIAFSTANSIPHYSKEAIINTSIIHEDKIDLVFRAAVDATQEAIVSSLYHSKTTIGRDGCVVYSINDLKD